jgi:hypothetical protein
MGNALDRDRIEANLSTRRLEQAGMRYGDTTPLNRYGVIALVIAAVLFTSLIGGWLLMSRNGAPAPGPSSAPEARVDAQADRVVILDISPARDSSLQRGGTVMITATVRYELVSAESAVITLVGQDSGNPRHRLGSLPQPRAEVRKGVGRITLSET